VSEFATQGQQGEVAIAVDYNADNQAPSAMNQIEAMHFSGGGIPSKGFSFSAKTKLLNKADPKYVRTGTPPAGDDLRLYDGGNLYFATSGCSNTNQIGKLEITYRFEVGLPTLLNQGGNVGISSAPAFTSSAPEAAGATTVAAQMLFSVATNAGGAVNTAGSIVPLAGNYLLTVYVAFANTGAGSTGTMDIRKNGTSIFAGLIKPAESASATLLTGSLDWGGFVTANGTDAFTVTMTDVYLSGTQTNAGNITFVPC
jgi:hypothetical protein